jgi:hypothetical protein
MKINRQHENPPSHTSLVDDGSVADTITAWEERLPRRTGWRADERRGFLALVFGQAIKVSVALQRWTGRIAITLSQDNQGTAKVASNRLQKKNSPHRRNGA